MQRERSNSTIDVVKVLALRGFGMVLGIISALGIVFLFGTSAIVDAYFFARRTIGSIQSVAEVLIETLMVPAMVRHLKSAGILSVVSLSRRYGRWVFLGGVVFALLAGLSAGPIVDLLAPGLSGEARDPAIVYFCLLLITVPLTLLTSVDSATFVALRYFSRPAALRLLPRLLLVTALIAVPFGLELTWVVVAFVLGALLMTALFQMTSRRILKRIRAESHTSSTQNAQNKMDMSGTHAMATIVLCLAVFAETTLDTYFASQAGIGALAILTLGQRISNIGASEMTRSLLSVYYTNLAEQAALGNTARYASEVGNAIRAMLFFIAPLGFLMFALAAPLCKVLLDFGVFGADAATLTTSVVAWVAIATVLRGPVAVQESAILANPAAEHLAFSTLSTGVSLLIRVAIVLVLMPLHGLMAVVYSAIGATLFKLVFGYVWLRFRCGLALKPSQVRQIASVILLAITSALICAGLLSRLPLDIGPVKMASLIVLSAGIAITVYVFGSAAAGINEGLRMRALVIGKIPGLR